MILSTVILSLGLLVAPVAGRDGVASALQRPANVRMQKVQLGEAVRRLSRQTGVPIRISPDVLGLAPNGAGTVIRELDLTTVPLRDGLRQMFAPLGMRVNIAADHVQIDPEPALLCLGRAPTWPELKWFSEIRAMRIGRSRSAINRLREKTTIPTSLPGAWTTLENTIRDVSPGRGDEVLTRACDRVGLAWCIDGDRIEIKTRLSMNQQRLNRPISLRINYRPLTEVFRNVAEKTGIDIRPLPGAVESLPVHVQSSFSINATNASARFVLDQLAAHTGLNYIVEESGVSFRNPLPSNTASPPPAKKTETDVPEPGGMPVREAPAAPGIVRDTASSGGFKNDPAGSSAADPYVGKIIVPMPDGRIVEWHVRLSELPQDLREQRREDLKRAFEQLREQLPAD